MTRKDGENTIDSVARKDGVTMRQKVTVEGYNKLSKQKGLHDQKGW